MLFISKKTQIARVDLKIKYDNLILSKTKQLQKTENKMKIQNKKYAKIKELNLDIEIRENRNGFKKLYLICGNERVAETLFKAARFDNVDSFEFTRENTHKDEAMVEVLNDFKTLKNALEELESQLQECRLTLEDLDLTDNEIKDYLDVTFFSENDLTDNFDIDDDHYIFEKLRDMQHKYRDILIEEFCINEEKEEA